MLSKTAAEIIQLRDYYESLKIASSKFLSETEVKIIVIIKISGYYHSYVFLMTLVEYNLLERLIDCNEETPFSWLQEGF